MKREEHSPSSGRGQPSRGRRPCAGPPPQRSSLDELSPGRRPLGVALSGGGVRATLTGLGALRLLSDIGRLGDVRHLTSVSGGSIVGGLTALKWNGIREAGFDPRAFDELVTLPLLELLTGRSLQRELYRRSWRTLSPRISRTDLLAGRLAQSLFGDTAMEELATGVWFEINAANLTAGTRFRFTQDLVGDYITGSVASSSYPVRVADAVAWSCAVPGLFNSTVLNDIVLPCQQEVGVPELVDGGVYDNLGSDALKVRPEMPGLFCVVVNAGGTFEPSPRVRRVPLVGELWRSNSVLYQQVASVRSRSLFEKFGSEDAASLDGCLFTLRSPYPVGVPAASRDGLEAFAAANPGESDEGVEELARYPTTLQKVDRGIALRLLYRGWWLAGALLCAYAPELVTEIPTYQAP